MVCQIETKFSYEERRALVLTWCAFFPDAPDHFLCECCLMRLNGVDQAWKGVRQEDAPSFALGRDGLRLMRLACLLAVAVGGNNGGPRRGHRTQRHLR